MIELDFKNEVLKASPIVGTAAADGASITTTFVGTPSPRAIICV